MRLWTDSLIPSNAFSPEDMATEEPCDITCRFCDGLLAIQDYPQGFPRPEISTETQRVLTRETIQRAFHATEVGLASHSLSCGVQCEFGNCWHLLFCWCDI
ncbi:uncharacterized protein LOC103854295 [Brassica rapa]|uniref:uncharacterized protein LOC103854295 n=1 Tax=Brassica campestris TaxID=3711 RepID=UPI0004F1C5FA|nr:uncharacterized protein LOC103854295 [Brassica rapa]XP_013654853.1 uncharacterized protein LOC106359752 [Brassica napus]